MIEIKYADQLLMPFVHVFLMGDTGSGKTSAAATFPYPFFILPKNEQSIVTLRGMRIPYVEVASSFEMMEAIGFLEGRYRQAAQFQKYAQAAQAANDQQAAQGFFAQAWEAFPWQTVVIESISHYCDLIIEDLTSGDGEVAINNAGVAAKGKGTSLHMMDQQKWGLLGAHMRNLHARLRNLPVHTVFTALAQVKEGKDGAPTTGGALFSGAMAYKLPSACDAIGYCVQMETSPPTYRVHFRKYKQFAARIRVPPGVKAPEYVDGLTWAKLAPLFGHAGQP